MKRAFQANLPRLTPAAACLLLGVWSIPHEAFGQVFVGQYNKAGYTAVNMYDGVTHEIRHSVESTPYAGPFAYASYASLAVSGTTLYGTNKYRVMAYTTAGDTISTSLITVPTTDTLTGLAISGNSLFVVDSTANTIGQYALDGTPINPSLITGLNNPQGIAISGSNIFVANQGSNSVGQYTTSGATVNPSLIQFSTSSGAANYGTSLAGIAVSGSDLYVSYLSFNTFAGAIGKYTTSGSAIDSVFIPAGGSTPQSLVASGSSLYFTDADGGRVRQYSTSGAVINDNLVSSINTPGAIAVVAPADPLASPTWSADASGNWSSSANWAGGNLPNNPNSDAIFGPVITAPRTINLNANTFAQVLSFSSPIPYTISGSAPLTLGGTGHASSYIFINAGSHVISAPIVVTGANLFVNTAAGTRLSTTTIDGVGANLTVTGTGSLVVSNRLNIMAISLAANAVLDIGTGSAIIKSMLFSRVRNSVIAFRNTGKGLGSTAAVPYATVGMIPNTDSSSTPFYSTFAGAPVVSTDILVKYTYIGDTDLSGSVDGNDLANIIEGISTNKTGWQWGDMNYDNKVDATDYALALDGYNHQGAPLSAPGDDIRGSIPEPTALPLIPLAAAFLTRRRR